MEVSEEQWHRMQTNRAAALQKRNANLRQWVPPKPNILARAEKPVFRCQTMSSRAQQPQQQVAAAASGKLGPSSGVMGELWLRDQLPRIGQTVRVVLEMCTPTKFKLLLSSNNGDQSSSFSQILLQHLSSVSCSQSCTNPASPLRASQNESLHEINPQTLNLMSISHSYQLQKLKTQILTVSFYDHHWLR
jgi:hypothetical protein